MINNKMGRMASFISCGKKNQVINKRLLIQQRILKYDLTQVLLLCTKKAITTLGGKAHKRLKLFPQTSWFVPNHMKSNNNPASPVRKKKRKSKRPMNLIAHVLLFNEIITITTRRKLNTMAGLRMEFVFTDEGI